MLCHYLLRVWMVIFVAFLSLRVEGIAHAASLQNPSFEDGLNHWTIPANFADQISIETTASHTGKQSLKIDTETKQNSAFAVQVINNAVSGADYQFSVWARVAPGSPTAQAAIKYELYNVKGANTAGEYSVAGLPANGDWQKISIAFQAAEDTTSLRFYLRVFGKSKVLFDDAAIEMPAISIVGSQKAAVEFNNPKNLVYQLSLKDAWTKSDLPQVYAELSLLNSSQTQKIKAQLRKVDERHLEVTVPVPAIAAGDYSLQFYYLNDGQELRTKTGAFIFTKVPARKPGNLSATGTLLHNGAPFFPIGMYHPNVADYPLLAANGFNAVQGNASQADLDAAQKCGIAIDVVLYGGMRVGANLQNSLDKIKQFANHPAVLSWKIMDEPDAHSVANEVPAAYRALKAADPKNPLELTLGPETLGAGKNLNFWTNFSDIIQLDRYPVPGNPLTWVSDFMHETVAHKQPWQNVQYVLQCGWKKDLSNQPSVAQARSMAYLALIEGAKGIWWYSMREGDGWDLTKTPLWPHIKEINAEIKVLSKPLMLGKVVDGISCDQSKVLFRAVEYQNETYLLVTNPENNPVQVTFTLPKNLRLWHPINMDVGSALTDHQLTLSLQGVDSRTLVLEE